MPLQNTTPRRCAQRCECKKGRKKVTFSHREINKETIFRVRVAPVEYCTEYTLLGCLGGKELWYQAQSWSRKNCLGVVNHRQGTRSLRRVQKSLEHTSLLLVVVSLDRTEDDNSLLVFTAPPATPLTPNSRWLVCLCEKIWICSLLS